MIKIVTAAAAFGECMGRIPWAIASVALGLGNFGTEKEAVEFMPVLDAYY